MEEIKIRELPVKHNIQATDYIPIEDEDGTKLSSAKNLRSLVLSSLYFDSIVDLKQSSKLGLKAGDIVETLGYYTPGDGGAARYVISYDPAAVEDNKLIHYLAYSDTLRAKMMISDKINVHQFGAIGDGVANDTDAIQSAIDNSENRIVEFSNNKTYVVRDTINVTMSNVVIKGNGAIIAPQYVDGIKIFTEDNAEFITSNISISELNFDCSRANKAIYLDNVSKVDIVSSEIDKVGSGGIYIENSIFVNIDKCRLKGNGIGSLIILAGSNYNSDAQENPVVSLSSRMINVTNCYFEHFSRAINVLTTGNGYETLNTLVNLINCYYCTKVLNSYCINISCPVEMINIDSNTVECSDTFLGFSSASQGQVSCRDLSCLNTAKMFDIGSTSGILHLSGNLNTDSYGIMFSRMNGTLHSNIAWDLMTKGANYYNVPIGQLFDNITPMHYNDTTGYSIFKAELTLNEARNIHINWDSAYDIYRIINGVKGQMIYIKSSTNKRINAITSHIVLSDEFLQLSAHKGVLLKCDGVKWIQIQDSSAISGEAGPRGLSAYEVWLQQEGNEGKTEEDYMDFLQGDYKIFVQSGKPNVNDGQALWVESLSAVGSSGTETVHDAEFHAFTDGKWNKCNFTSIAKNISYSKGDLTTGLTQTNVSDELDLINETLQEIPAANVLYDKKADGNINQTQKISIQQALEDMLQVLVTGSTNGIPAYILFENKLNSSLGIISGRESTDTFRTDTVSGGFIKTIDLRTVDANIMNKKVYIQVSVRCRNKFPRVSFAYSTDTANLSLLCDTQDASCYVEWQVISVVGIMVPRGGYINE